MTATIIDAIGQRDLWHRRIRLAARIHLTRLGATGEQADAIISDLLKRADQMPAAASDAPEPYYGQVVLAAVEILWRRRQRARTTAS